MTKLARKLDSLKTQCRTHTTVGELLSAAYEVTGGRPASVARLLERGEIARVLVGSKLRFI